MACPQMVRACPKLQILILLTLSDLSLVHLMFRLLRRAFSDLCVIGCHICRLPLYGELKAILLAWLVLPHTKGAHHHSEIIALPCGFGLLKVSQHGHFSAALSSSVLATSRGLASMLKCGQGYSRVTS